MDFLPELIAACSGTLHDELSEKCDSLLKYRNELGQSILHIAVNNGNDHLVSSLTNQINCDLKDRFGYTALDLACMSTRGDDYTRNLDSESQKLQNEEAKNMLSIVRTLGFMTNNVDHAFYISIMNNKVKYFDLLKAGADFDFRGTEKSSILHAAVQSRDLDMVKRVYDLNPELLLVTDDHKRTPAVLAVESRQPNIAYFLEKKSNPNITYKEFTGHLYEKIKANHEANKRISEAYRIQLEKEERERVEIDNDDVSVEDDEVD